MSEPKKTIKTPELKRMSRPMWGDYGLLTGRIGKVGGKDVVVTHRNPSNGDLWCEGLRDDPDKDCWIDADKVEIL